MHERTARGEEPVGEARRERRSSKLHKLKSASRDPIENGRWSKVIFFFFFSFSVPLSRASYLHIGAHVLTRARGLENVINSFL